jgi:hypothetical protein
MPRSPSVRVKLDQSDCITIHMMQILISQLRLSQKSESCVMQNHSTSDDPKLHTSALLSHACKQVMFLAQYERNQDLIFNSYCILDVEIRQPPEMEIGQQRRILRNARACLTSHSTTRVGGTPSLGTSTFHPWNRWRHIIVCRTTCVIGAYHLQISKWSRSL